MTLWRDWVRQLQRQRELPRDPLQRRRFLTQLALSGAALALSATAPRVRAEEKPRFVAYPFTLGVASGYPHPQGFTLWTRLAPAPFEVDGGMPPDRHPVLCEIAEDEQFRQIVQTVNFETAPEVAHSAHLDIRGLAPGRPYFYRFQCGDAVSPIGRTHTLPAGGQALDRYRIAFGSCQNYEHGYFSAYRQMQRDQPDLVMFLGDYIYENPWGDQPVRRHLGGEATTLHGYRQRHAQYKLDADLQAMQARLPWVYAWDDHEVDNDYAGEQSENLDPAFVLRRAAAYQAYFEHLPLPRSMYPRANGMRTYTHFDIGDLLRVYLLDDRQYRTPQACPRPNRHASRILVGCEELQDPAQTLLGSAQEAWLDQAFASSRARWNLIGQQTLVAPIDEEPGAPVSVWTDGWDGYPLARQRLIAGMQRAGLSNPVIAGGDLHCAVVADVPSDPTRPDSAPIASEFVATSISAEAWPQAHYDAVRGDNPHIRQMRADQRGYTLLQITRDEVRADLKVVSDVHVQSPEFSTQASYRVEAGRPGPQRV
ncbi:MAG: alkaline phosphatase D family protein [Lysobacterales bacterium]